MGADPTEEEVLPDWYYLLKAAKWLGVAPWDLATQPAVWLEFTLEAMNAEAVAQKQEKQTSEIGKTSAWK